MNSSAHRKLARKRVRGMTLVEIMVSTALATIVLTMVMILYMFGMRSFGSMGNYAEMDGQSRQSLDRMMREIRSSSMVVGIQNSGSTKWIKLASLPPASDTPVTNLFTWDSNTGKLLWDKTGEATKTILTGCDIWNVSMFQRTPQTNGGWKFTETSNQTICKLVNMSWNCSRTNIIKKFNSESMVTAQIVLRNKP